MFQGIDFTDTGFELVYFQQIFSDPASVSYWFHLWLTNVIGGIWNILFGWGGLLSFKFGAVIIFWLTAYCVYLIYKGLIIPKYLFPAMFMGMLFHFIGKISVIHYNNVSTLFLLLGAYFMFHGIDKKSRLFIFLSGAIFILAAAARFPNIMSLAFIIVPVYAWILNKSSKKNLIKDMASFILGVLAASVAVTIAMVLLGHFQLYWHSVIELFSSSNEKLSGYSGGLMLRRFYVDWKRAVLYALIMIFFSFYAAFVLRYIKNIYINFFCQIIFSVIALLCSTLRSYSNVDVIQYTAIGFIALTCLGIFFLEKKYDKQKILALMSILLLSILSIGSDTGMQVGTYAILFGIPLTLWYWFELNETRIILSLNQEKTTRRIIFNLSGVSRRYIISIISSILIIYGVSYVFLNEYRDNRLRWKMNTPVNTQKLIGVLTTKKRSESIESLLLELNKYVKSGDIILTYESIPMVYFLTETRPYLYNSWPIQYLPAEFDYALNKARAEHPELPVAVLATVETRSNTWPNSGSVHMDERSIANRSALYQFFEAEGYNKVWNNEAFQILVPPAELKGRSN
jgi:hypothetical protein